MRRQGRSRDGALDKAVKTHGMNAARFFACLLNRRLQSKATSQPPHSKEFVLKIHRGKLN
jgi:hypothetical protein